MDTVVVFDIDDTLCLERDYVRSGFEVVGQYVRRQLGLDGFAQVAWAAFQRGVRGDTFDLALDHLGVPPDPELVNNLVVVYRSHRPDIDLLPDALEALRLCAEHGRGIAIVSDGAGISQRAKVAALGLERWATPIVVTDEHNPCWTKPSTKPFRCIEHTYGRATNYTYVADNPAKDFTGPARLGWHTYRVRRPDSLHEGVPSGPEVETEYEDLSRLSEWLWGRASG